MRLGHLGPAGTFTEEAARAAAAAHDAELVPFPTVRDTVLGVLAGDVDAALVPIENSLEGTVPATVDALSSEPRLRMVGEALLAVEHCLVARREIALEQIAEVRSHPQALAQCARFLRDELPQAQLVGAGSTADAVRSLEESDPRRAAAIASRDAAALHGGVVLRTQIADEAHNTTRFAWLAAGEATAFPLAGGQEAGWKTSILFAGAGDAQPGWLVRCLSELAFRGVNLVKIESRPARRQLGHYLFFADCEGRDDDERVAAAVAALRAHCDQVRVLGSYPAAPGTGVS